MSNNINIKKELERPLGPEYISFRNTGYSEEPYIEGWTAIQMANRIFGYDGWSSHIIDVNTVNTEDTHDGRSTVAAKAHVRITLTNGIFREDIGFGIAERVNGKGKAIKQAYKSAVTDAIKRTLKQFGKALGSCCNDKNYIRHIKQVKKKTCPINESDLIRPGSDLFTVHDSVNIPSSIANITEKEKQHKRKLDRIGIIENKRNSINQKALQSIEDLLSSE
ncbi:DNA repair and recombination protein RAD52 [Nematocida sp. AWRm78]|nr:DNA repair and recombination protein RAD52 [Nematocida sp. AWRm79]KAI5186398.1 DNA repair and recombination protein RAD52 [Nematocida sp. AWRm78]